MDKASPEQLTIFDAIENSTDSLVIESVAGSGKTTTIVEASKKIPKNSLAIFLAFNKNIATELQNRLPSHVQAKTFHSHGFAALQRNLPQRPRVDGDKVRRILEESLSEKEFFQYAPFVQRLVGYAKNAGIGIFTEVFDTGPWFQLIDYFGMIAPFEDFDEAKAVKIAIDALEENNARTYVVDFDDMLYLTLLKGCTFDRCNYVFVDEAQDTNVVQRALLHRMLAKDGRLIAVGDSAQAIYAFRGASSGAMDEIADEFKCRKLSLSVSFRCAKNVVARAKTYVPLIEPHPDSPDGEIIDVYGYMKEDFTSSEVILCRNVAPLVSMCFGFIRRGRGVRILGREIGQGLITLVKRFKTDDVDVMLEKLERYRSREYEKLLRRGNESQAEAVNDKCSCIQLFADALDEDSRSCAEIIRRIESMFNDQQNGGLLTLCSVHKAKGLEWDTVNILDFDTLMPSKWAKKDWQKVQEKNLIYVAITRAKRTLKFISSDNWKDKQTVKTKEEEALDSL